MTNIEETKKYNCKIVEHYFLRAVHEKTNKNKTFLGLILMQYEFTRVEDNNISKKHFKSEIKFLNPFRKCTSL